MRRKNWISVVCGGALLLATAAPAMANGGEAIGPTAVVQRVMDWMAGWIPVLEIESERAAGTQKGDQPDAPTATSSCQHCNGNGGELNGVIDPDG